MRVDESAPVIVRRSATVAAPPAVVWALLAGIEDWPRWQHEVEYARLSGPLEPGTTFRWKAGRFGIRSRLEEVEPERSIGWSGGALGVHARHSYRLEPAEGGTLVSSEESWSGLLPRVLPGRSRVLLERGVGGALAALREEAERRAAAP
ncbi:MAG TPA: SRPBCC family protein [Gaiellaceae bacterium]|nr:SRPBCC family protein [Gaiellaceae bacterium]